MLTKGKCHGRRRGRRKELKEKRENVKDDVDDEWKKGEQLQPRIWSRSTASTFVVSSLLFCSFLLFIFASSSSARGLRNFVAFCAAPSASSFFQCGPSSSSVRFSSSTSLLFIFFSGYPKTSGGRKQCDICLSPLSSRLSSSLVSSSFSSLSGRSLAGRILKRLRKSSFPFASSFSSLPSEFPPPPPPTPFFYSPLRSLPFMASTVPQVPWKPPGGREYPTWLDLPNRLLRDRILLIGQFVDEEISNHLIATLLYLYSENPSLPICLYFNSPGGLLKPCLALYDTLHAISSPCTTINIGLASGMIAFLCAAGSPGKRFALPNARFLIQRGSADEPIEGVASDVSGEVREALVTSERILVALAKSTRQPLEKLRRDLKRDFYLSAAEAKLYGVIDAVLLPKFSRINERAAATSTCFGKFEGPDKQRYQIYREDSGWGGKPPVAQEDTGNEMLETGGAREC